MRPTNPPDDFDYGMPGEDGTYEYENYDEDDFFYHMYFDEVSTTPLPEEFYDILESVSAGSNPQPAAYPDYFDYFLNEERIRQANEEETTTEISSRQSKNSRYLRWKKSAGINQTRPAGSRRNSKFMKSIKQSSGGPRPSRPNSKVRSKRSPGRGKKVKKHWKKELLKLRRRKKRRRESKAGKRFSRGRGIIGILDRRIPAQFRQADFISISLASFVILSTGVTTSE